MPPRFHESQRMTMAWVWALVGLLAAGAWIVFGGHLIGILDLGPNPPPIGLSIALLAILGVGLPWLTTAFRLVTEVDDDALRFSIRPLLRRRVPRSSIARAEAVRYRPLRDYLGWGIRWMPGRGWAYTVQGERGVRVHLRDGRSFLLGSRRPDELATALGPGPSG